MKSQLVLVEKEDKVKNTVFGCSGLMLKDKYVITTANILLDNDKQKIFEQLTPGRLCSQSSSSDNSPLNVVWIENGLYVVKRAYIFSAFSSEHIKNSSKSIFQNWAIDSIDNNRDLNKILSLFFVLTFEVIDNIEDFKNTLEEWWYCVGRFDISQGDTIYIKTASFGNRNFINSYTKGIVSNIVGNNSCFILSDCPSTPGSEGSPVYLFNKGDRLKSEVPIGLVLSSLSWYKGEWVGLTLLVDIRPIILELIDIPIRVYDVIKKMDNPKIRSTIDFSLVRVQCGKTRGTAVLLSEEEGIFITNAHVIEDPDIFCIFNNKSRKMEFVYKTQSNGVFDLAIIKCETNIIQKCNLKSIPISRKVCKIGDSVYSAGFSLFPMECQPTPTLSKGCVSHNNPVMLKTTCCVHPGASGGAILDDEGALLGIIVCNTRLHANNTVYPRVNMAIPFSAMEDVISEYLEKEVPSVLNKLNMKNKEEETVWKRLEGKL